MLNTSQLNTAQLNALFPTTGLAVADYDALEFDGFSLQNDNVVSTSILSDSTPSRELSTFKIPRGDGAAIIGDYFRERKVKVSGYLKQATSELLEEAVDEMKRRLMIREGYLTRNINGSLRRARATLTNPEGMFAGREGYHITYCPFELEFTVLEPMWHAFDYTAVESFGITNLSFSENLENLGTYKSDGVLIIVVDAAVSVTALSFTNSANDGSIAITHALVAGDVLIFDGEQKSVTLNGAEIDYNGSFPKMEYGTNPYTITVTGTSISYNATLKAKKSYL